MRDGLTTPSRSALALADVVHGAFAARNRRDIDAMLDAFTDDIEYAIQGAVAGRPIVPVIHGKTALRGFLSGFLHRWDWNDLRITNVIITAGFAVVESDGSFLHCVSGQRFDTTSCDVLEFRDGKIAKIRCYSDTFTIVRVAGLAM